MHDLRFLAFEADFSAPDLANTYDELPLWSSMFGLLLLDEVPMAGVTMALDVGCGTGFPLIELAERLGSTAQMHGVDPWGAGLSRAAEKVRNREIENVTLHEGSAVAMPFDAGVFDLIVSNLGVNNFEDRQAAVRECRRVIRDGGTIALTTNLQGHMREFYDAFSEVLRSIGDEAGLDRLEAHVQHRATVASVRTLLEGERFTVVRIAERQATMRFANGSALLNHHFIKLGFLDGWKSIVAGNEAAVFARLLDRLDAHAAQNGELALTIPMAYIEAKAA